VRRKGKGGRGVRGNQSRKERARGGEKLALNAGKNDVTNRGENQFCEMERGK